MGTSDFGEPAGEELATCLVGRLRVNRDRGRVSSKSGYVRSAPKATELLRRHETTRWANTCRQSGQKKPGR
jgi:hypothetical protein